MHIELIVWNATVCSHMFPVYLTGSCITVRMAIELFQDQYNGGCFKYKNHITVQLPRICMLIWVQLSKGLSAGTLNGHWALPNCEIWTQCNVTLLVSRLSAVSTCLSSGLRVIWLCGALALWIQYVTFISSSLGRPSLFVSLCVWMFLSSLHFSLLFPFHCRH